MRLKACVASLVSYNMKKHIPNIITLCNLISGCIATCLAFQGETDMALAMIVVGAVFDFFDGMSARLLGVSSPVGKELDSLADVITFGVAPSTMLFYELLVVDYPAYIEPLRPVLPYVAYVMAAFSALRLAKFNLDERQALGFIGMPTPANALFWGSLVVGYKDVLSASSYTVFFLIVLMLVMSWLLVSEVPMFALKFKHWGLRQDNNAVKYAFVAFSVIALCVGQIAAIALIIVAYIIVSVVLSWTSGNKQGQIE